MKVRPSRKTFAFILLVILAMVCLLFPVQFYMKAFANGKPSKGSTIGGVSVSGMNDEEIKEALEKAIQEWGTEPILIQGAGIELAIDAQELPFDLDRTIQTYRNLTRKPFFLFWTSDKVVHIPIEISESQSIKDQISNIAIWDAEETYHEIVMQASYLKSHKVKAAVADTAQLENERIALSIENIPKSASGVQALAETLDGYILQPDKPFSLLTVLEKQAEVANKEGLNFFGSMLYNTVLQTKTDILERHPQREIPNYLQPGMAVYVDAFFEKDLQFMNVSEQPYLLKATVEGERLKVELYSGVKEADVQVFVEQQAIAPRIINRYSKKLPAGTTKLIQEGKQGLRVTVTRTISENGEEKTQLISRDYYAPINRIVLNSASFLNIGENESGTMEEVTDQRSSGKVENVDLNGDGLPDYDDSNDVDKRAQQAVKGGAQEIYYDKSGNLITP